MRISDWSSDVCSSELLRRRNHPDHAVASKRLRNELSHGRDTVDEERRIVLPDGSTRWIAVRGRVLRAADGEPLRTIGVIEDVTARKDEEAAFRRSASRMEAALRAGRRSEEHTSELQSLMRSSYAVFCLKTNKK